MKKIRLLLFSAFIMVWIFAMVAGCSGGGDDGDGGNATPTAAGSGNISGIVYDQDGSPLKGAVVTYETELRRITLPDSVITDSNGAFLLENVPEGDCRVTVEKDEDEASHIVVDVEHGETDVVSLRVKPVGTLQGTVTDDTSEQGLQGVAIDVSMNDGIVISETTNSDGYYNIENLYVGEQTVTAVKSGYLSQTATITINQDQITVKNFALKIPAEPGGVETPTPSYNKVYALFIGVGKYPGTGNDLDYAEADAKDLKAALEDCSAWKDAEITILLSDKAQKSTIKKTITSIAENAEKGDLFLMTYSGHGTNLGTKGAMCVWDGEEDAYVTDEDVSGWIKDLACPYIFINDSCHSAYWASKSQLRYTKDGVKYTVRLRTDAPGYDPDFRGTFDIAKYRGMGNIDNIVICAAAGKQESAVENGTLKHGYFTYYILQGLGKGSTIGPADTDKSGYISGEEIFNYSKPKVVEYSNSKQNPVMADNYPTVANPAGDLMIKK